MKTKKIMYFTRNMGLGGTENVILQLCEIMKCEVDNIIVCSSGGVNVDKLSDIGIKHFYIPDIEKKDLKTIILVFKKLIKIIKEEKIDIIHTHHRMAAFYISILSRFKKFIFINTQHNIFNDRKVLTKIALGKANNIAVGKGVEENLTNFYKISNSKVKIIYNGIKNFNNKDFNTIDIIKKYKNEGYFTIGNIGRISKQKDMETFVKSIPLILKENKKVQFFIVGTGEDEMKIKKLIDLLDIREKVCLLGYRNDIQNVMSNLDLIVLSSLWEGLPLTPIEAFSVSKTIIATNIEGTKEVVEDNINGILIKPKDEFMLAQKALNLIKNNVQRNKLELNAYNTYINKFSYEELKRNYKEYYNSIIDEI